DSEGFPGIASLFRAAARAEEIHAKNHLDVIHKFGKEAVADIKAPEVKSTKENLEAAIKGETYEMNEMYPQFLAAARKEKQKDAIKTFNGAMEAEKEHAKLYAEALANMDKNKVGAIEFMVCPTCGYTLKKAKLEKCPVCFTPGEKFEIVK
ncbi:MAG: hypothetical protein QG635_42, partial [Bacteroidota bacterium]|nr:hypothetical protein [Bacteroidota bacterium]